MNAPATNASTPVTKTFGASKNPTYETAHNTHDANSTGIGDRVRNTRSTTTLPTTPPALNAATRSSGEAWNFWCAKIDVSATSVSSSNEQSAAAKTQTNSAWERSTLPPAPLVPTGLVAG